MLAVLLISLTLQARGQTGDNTNKTSVPDSGDISKAFDLVLAVQAGSGMNVSQRHLPNAYLGIKIGGPIAEKSGPPRFFHAFILDLGYDRSHQRNGDLRGIFGNVAHREV